MSFSGASAGSNALKLEIAEFSRFAGPALRHATTKGFLVKQGQFNTYSYKRRYFALFGNCLYYFKSEDPSTTLGMVWLEGCVVQAVESDGGAGAGAGADGFGFQITTCAGREYKILASTTMERDMWMSRISDSSTIVLQQKVTSISARLTESLESVSRNEREIETLQQEVEVLRIARTQLDGEVERLKEANLKLQQEVEEMGLRAQAAEGDRDMVLKSRGIFTRTIPTWVQGAENSVAKIWAGSWNMGANEPFVGMDRGRAPKLLRNFVAPGYDIYLLGVQEGASDTTLEAIESLLGMEGCVRLRLDTRNEAQGVGAAPEPMDKLYGRGDGSLLSPKYTGVAVYIREQLLPQVRVLGCTQRAFSPIHSKGGVAVALSVKGQNLVFVTCHLEAHKNELRRQQYRELCTHLGSQLGESDFLLNVQFHHIIWCGDFNYRCVDARGESMNAEMVCKQLEQGQNRRVFESYDQLNQERAQNQVFYGFREPVPYPDFFPTYKKLENRPPLDYSDPSWVRLCYRTKYKEPFYKGGKVKERTPGYCDRVLYYSMPSVSDALVPETVLSDFLVPQQFTSFGSNALTSMTANVHNYRSINDGECMSVSDHSPVCATFLLRLTRPENDTLRGYNKALAIESISATEPTLPELSSGRSVDSAAVIPILSPISSASERDDDMDGRTEYRASPTVVSTHSAGSTKSAQLHQFGTVLLADAASERAPRIISSCSQFRIRISDIKCLCGSTELIPFIVRVLFPAPFEILQAEGSVTFDSERLDIETAGPNSSPTETVTPVPSGESDMEWKQFPSTTGTCLSLALYAHEASGALPALFLEYNGPATLDTLHLCVRVQVAPPLNDTESSRKLVLRGNRDTMKMDKAREQSHGQCAVALDRLSGMASVHTSTRTHVSHLLLKDGLPMRFTDPRTGNRELVFLHCFMELIPYTKAQVVL